MEIKKWVELMSRSGKVCPEYMRKVAAAETPQELYRVLCDANGGRWLFELHASGIPVPVAAFCSEFKRYAEGSQTIRYPQGYSSRLLCRQDGDVMADTTLLYLLECSPVRVTVPRNAYPTVILSKGTVADIVVGSLARLNIEAYGDARWTISGDQTRVRVIHH